MVAFNFKPEFKPLILSGEKRSTIRQTKRCKVGDAMQLYTGQRTKNCEKILEAICIGTAQITITSSCGVYYSPCEGTPVVISRLHEQEGFMNVKQMVDFFHDHYGLPFTGWIHTWEKLV